MNNTIGIMGCGWLGTPLALHFIKEGHTVHGSTTTSEKLGQLEDLGILPFKISLSENGIAGPIEAFLKNVKVLIINVPPNLRGETKENYEQKMKLLHDALKHSDVVRIIFISSTSVYGDLNGDVTETTVPYPETESGKQLLASEETFSNDPKFDTTVIRFGGLIGPDRHPINFLSGKNDLKNGNHPVNLIHLEDCIHIIQAVLKEGYCGNIINGVYPLHPTKKEYYTHEAEKRGLKIPSYSDAKDKEGKKVIPYNLEHYKKYKFQKSIVS